MCLLCFELFIRAQFNFDIYPQICVWKLVSTSRSVSECPFHFPYCVLYSVCSIRGESVFTNRRGGRLTICHENTYNSLHAGVQRIGSSKKNQLARARRQGTVYLDERASIVEEDSTERGPVCGQEQSSKAVVETTFVL
jgi:hypothetical protein